MSNSITIHLLDSGHGHPLQTWTFDDRQRITMGRSGDNDVVLADPYVSRAHARLEYDDGEWRLIAVSDRLVFVEGMSRKEAVLSAGTVFRLGLNGCHLRFGEEIAEPNNNSATMSFDPVNMPILKLDNDRLQQDVKQVADDPYFQRLREATQRLRSQRRVVETQI